MRSFLHAAAAATVALLLLVAHRASYKGFFTDDDLDNLVVTRQVSLQTFAAEFAKPVLSDGNFRPSGHLFYKVMGQTAGLRFTWYVAVLHLIHALNILLVWLLLRKMGAPPTGTWTGALLFAFHMAVFDALWKPMYIFDILCGTFTLLTLLLYLNGRWALALIPFWFGYKSKELIVVLPLLLLAWELMAGERRWKRVIPFALISACFTLQAVAANAGKNDDYTLRFSSAALAKTLPFYGSALLLVPYLGLCLPLLLLLKDAKIRWGILFLFLIPAPLWFLPGRLFSVYLYVPLIGMAVAFAFLASRMRLAWVGLFFLLWIPGNYYVLRQKRSEALDAATENRAYVLAVGDFLKANGPFDAMVYDDGPARLNFWGRIAAVRWWDARPELMVCSSEKPDVDRCMAAPRVAVLAWNRSSRALASYVKTPETMRVSSIDFSREVPLGVLDEGWYGSEPGYRWTHPEAIVKLHRPAAARAFTVRVNASPVQLKEQGEILLELLLDGHSLGTRAYSREAWSEQSWPVPAGAEGPAVITLRALKPFRPSNGDPRILGAAVGALGFDR